MSMTGFTNYSTVDGQQVFVIADVITGTAAAVDESILIKDVGAIRASGTGVITFTRCQIYIDDVPPAANWWAIQEAALSYNGLSGSRFGVSSHINFIDCQIIFLATATRAIFISQVQNTRVFNVGSTVRLYTQEGTVLDRQHTDTVTWELIGNPSSSGNLRLENMGAGPTNFDSGRMDLPYINEVNVPVSCTLGNGNSGDNTWVMWNRVAFDNTTVSMSTAASKYFDGITNTSIFTDRDNGTPEEDVRVILSSDRSGSMTELGRYLTNSSGKLVGTYNSKEGTTGSSQERGTLYVVENEADQSGSSHGTGAFSYDLTVIETRLEVRAYGFNPSTNYSLGDSYPETIPVGSINSDYTDGDFATFTLNNDLNAGELNPVTVAAYTDLGPYQKLYDRSRYEWWANDDYPVIELSGAQLVLDDIVLTLDATAGSVYTAASLTAATAKLATFTGGATATTGKLVLRNGALLNSSETITCDVEIDNTSTGDTYTGVTATKIIHTGTSANALTLDGTTVTELEVTGGATLTVALTNGAAAPTTTETSGTITLIRNVNVTNANLINLTRVQLYNVTKDAEIDNSVVSGGGGYSYTVDLLGSEADDGDVLRIRGTYVSGVTAKAEYEESGVVTSAGLSLIGSQEPCPVYDAWGLDGSAITKFSADYVNDEVDVVIASNYELREMGAWWKYNLTTSQGISDFYGGITMEDESNLLINNAIVDIFLDNTTSTNVHQTDNRRLYRTDLARPVNDPTTGGGGVDVEWRAPVVIANSDSLTASLAAIETKAQADTRQTALIAEHDATQVDIAALNDLSAVQVNTEVDTALTDYDGPTKTEMDAGFAALNDVSAAQVNAEVDTALTDYDGPTKTEMDSGFAGLNDLSAAQVNTEVDTALTDYDGPTKAEMDSGFAGLNDLSAAQVNTEVDTALTDYDGPTKTEMDAGFAALNNLSTADIDARLAAYGIPTLTEMTASFAQIKGAGWTTTDTLEAIMDAVDAGGSGGATAAEVWAYATRVITGGANTVAPDNAGITANGAAIALLETKTQADTRQTALVANQVKLSSGVDKASKIIPYTKDV